MTENHPLGNAKTQMIKSIFGVLLPTLLGMFILSEVFVRFFIPQQLVLIRPDIWCPDASTGWNHCPNVSTEINSGEGTVKFHTDFMGHRIDPHRIRNDPDIRILALGDSFLEAIQVNDNETLAEKIAVSLEKKYQREIVVVNTGVGQWNPNQYLLTARSELRRQKYDLGIVLLYLGNDVVSSIQENFEPRKPTLRHQVSMPHSASWQSIIHTVLYPINDFLETRSQLFILAKKSFSVSLMKLGLTGHSISPVFLKQYASSKDWETTATLCRTISDEFEKNQIPVLFVFIPTSYQINPKEFHYYLRGFGIAEEITNLEQPNQILGETLSRMGVDVLDPLKNFRGRQQTGEILYGLVDNHLTTVGIDLLASLLSRKIESKLNIKVGHRETE